MPLGILKFSNLKTTGAKKYENTSATTNGVRISFTKYKKYVVANSENITYIIVLSIFCILKILILYRSYLLGKRRKPQEILCLKSFSAEVIAAD